ncbi:MAG: DNA-processing protein DprA [Hyphomicrobiaceae bacterium]
MPARKANERTGARTPVPPPSHRLSEAQRHAWLRLIRAENVGPVTFRELINHFGGAEEALDALPELSRRGGRGKPIRVPSRRDIEAELARADAAGAHLVAIGEPGYPRALASVDAPPPLLYVKGRSDLLARPMVAIVGARSGSAAGQKMARLLATDLGRGGFVVASGLARGIDGAVHRAALERGTAAVVAGGIDVVYPPEHAELQQAIGRDGCLVSERPPGLEPRGQDFPRRNRIIAGMSLGVIVVEAAQRSGSLITARMAAEIGREVLAVPGHPLDPRAEGTNRLLKQGATLVTCADDVIDCLRPQLEMPLASPPSALLAERDAEPGPEPTEIGTERERVLAALGPTPVDINEIARASGVGIRNVQIVLLELDLAGRLERHTGHTVSLVTAGGD